jgi:hypothetical protein
VAVGQVVELATPIRYEGDVTILPVLEEVEVVVIARRLILKEEIHVRRRRVAETHLETISLRDKTAVVTRFFAGRPIPPRPSTPSQVTLNYQQKEADHVRNNRGHLQDAGAG